MRLGDLLTQTFNQREFILLHRLDVASAETDLEPPFQGIKKAGREGNDLLRVAEQGLHVFCRYDDDIRRASVYIIDDLHILAERLLSVHELFNDMSSFNDFSFLVKPHWQKR